MLIIGEVPPLLVVGTAEDERTNEKTRRIMSNCRGALDMMLKKKRRDLRGD